MKVNETALQQLLRAYNPKVTGESNAAKGGAAPADEAQSPSDAITISSEGQELQRAIKAAQQTDEVRSERVDQIRTQLRTGSYLLDPQAIANRMLGLGGGQ